MTALDLTYPTADGVTAEQAQQPPSRGVAATHVDPLTFPQPFAPRVALRNAAGLVRWIGLCAQHHGRLPLFYLGARGEVDLPPGADFSTGPGLRIMSDFSGRFLAPTRIGSNVFFNRGCTVAIHAGLTIGDDCAFGEYVSIHDEDHVYGAGIEDFTAAGFVAAPITIGRNVWIASHATILKGVTIGDNAVVAAGAVVTRDVPANSVVGGLPARVLKTF